MPSRLRELYEKLTADTELDHPLFSAARATYRWAAVFYQKLEHDAAFIRAAGMAYTTLIALVPSLLLVFSILDAFGLLDAERAAFESLVFQTFLADIPEVRDIILPGLLQVDLATLGVVGVIGLVAVAARLYLMVERAYCDIFQTPVDRALPFRLLNFYFTFTAAPIALALMMLGASEIVGGRFTGGGVGQAFSLVVPFVMIFAALKLFPTTRVRWQAALLGATVSWVLFVAAGRLFPLYIQLFASEDPLRVIYGSVGLLPIFLLWLYLLWLIVLLGVEVAYVAQNYRSLVQAELDEQEMKEASTRVMSLADGLELAIRLAWHFEHSDGPVPQERLAEEAAMTQRELRLVLDVLARTELVVQTGESWIMARSPGGIPLREVAERWRHCTGLRRMSAEGIGDALAERLQVGLEGTLADAADRWLGGAPGA